MPRIGVKAGQADHPRRRPAPKRTYKVTVSRPFSDAPARTSRGILKRPKRVNSYRTTASYARPKPRPKRTVPRPDIQGGHGKGYGGKHTDRFKQSKGYKQTLAFAGRQGDIYNSPREVFRRAVIRGDIAHWRAAGKDGFELRVPKLGGLGHEWHPAEPKFDKWGRVKNVSVKGGSGLPSGAILNTLGAASGRALFELGTGGLTHVIPGAAAATAGIAHVAENAGKDYLNLPAQAVTSTYKTAVDIAKNPKKGIQQDVIQPYKDLAKHPGKAFMEHPLNSALMVEGIRGGVSRGIGRTGQALGVNNLDRKPITVAGTGVADPRRYSPDIMVKGVQKAVDKHRAGRRAKLEAKAARQQAAGAGERADATLVKAARGDLKRQNRVLKRRVDEHMDVTEQIRRAHRTQAVHGARKALEPSTVKRAKGKVTRPSAAVSLNVQRIASPAELATYRQKIAHVAATEDLRPSRRRANKVLQREIAKAQKADPAAVERASVAYSKVVEPLQGKLVEAGVLNKAQVARAKLIPYAVTHMGAKHVDGAVVDKHGQPLPDSAIVAHMNAHGVKPPTFVTQAPNLRSAGAYFQDASRPQRLAAGRRTGESTRAGTFDAHPERLVEQVARMQGHLDAHQGFKNLVHEFAARPHVHGKPYEFKSYTDAINAAKDLHAEPGSGGWRPVRANAMGAAREQLDSVLHGTSLPERALPQQMEAALNATSGKGPWVLVPESAAKQMGDHAASLGTGPKALQLGTQAFRKAVLSTSPTWATGNVLEAGLRDTIAHAGPRSLVTYHNTVKRLEKIDPAAAEAFKARTVGGGHFAFAGRQVRRLADQFDGTRMEGIARAATALGKTPGPKQVAGLWQAYTHAVFGGMGWVESQFQKAAAGKVIREQMMDGHLSKMFGKAVEQAAQGLRGTNEQVAVARKVDEIYGKYSKFPPNVRKAYALYTPFAPWFVAAVKFATITLPKDHPVLTALLASENTATQEWRRQHGLDVNMKHGLPAFLQGTIPTAGGAHQRFPVRYTPFSAFGDLPGNAANLVLPQASGILEALKGNDWKGSPLNGPYGAAATPGQKFGAAGINILMDSVPFLSPASRVSGKGIQALNPAAPIKKKSSSSSSSGGSTKGLPTVKTPVVKVPTVKLPVVKGP